ncbi:MAG: cytochrome P450 [Deltaproteobacteria bacterium]|nr:cytochrome P450 [Deltaproteobacteria bacterium]
MRANAPVYYDEEAAVWGITLHEDILAISKDPDRFCSAQGSRPETESWVPSMINMDDPDHRRRRALVNRGFTPRRVADHEAAIRQICNDLVDSVAKRGHCDFVRDLAAPLPMIVIGDMLGVRPEDRERLLRWSEEMLGATSATASPEARQRAAAAGGEYVTYALDVIAQRRSDPQIDDLIGVLVHSEIEGERLDEEALIHESLLILVGGDETTRHVITGGMRALIEHPEQRQMLLDDPSKIPTAVEEMLRWVSPIKNMNRTATRDVELRGQQIREGDKLLLLYHSANRDERMFENPDRFDIERTPNEHVAFGGYGRHFCLGSSLAKLELRVFFEEVLPRLPDLALADGADLALRPSNFIAGIEEMQVRFEPHV